MDAKASSSTIHKTIFSNQKLLTSYFQRR